MRTVGTLVKTPTSSVGKGVTGLLVGLSIIKVGASVCSVPSCTVGEGVIGVGVGAGLVTSNVGSLVASPLITIRSTAVSQSPSPSHTSYTHSSSPSNVSSGKVYRTSVRAMLMMHSPKTAGSTMDRTVRPDPVSFSRTPMKASWVPAGRLMTSLTATTRPAKFNGGGLMSWSNCGMTSAGGIRSWSGFRLSAIASTIASAMGADGKKVGQFVGL